MEDKIVEKAAQRMAKDFEYLLARLSPDFFQRFDKALNTLSTLHYDLEVLKI